jgi:hypothetical protein
MSSDRNDGKPWTHMDIEDLELAVRRGVSLEEAAAFLCRAGTVDDVRRKAAELGLTRLRSFEKT